MDTLILQTTDLAGASYSVVLMGLIATSILLFFGTGWVRDGWKLPVALCGIAALVGVVTVFEARNVWLSYSQVPVVYHYAGWIISIPLQVVAIYFFVRQVGSVSVALFWRFVAISILMVLVRYMGDVGFMHATLAFLISIIFWLYILGELFFGKMDEVVSKSMNPPVQRGFFWLRLIITIGWAIYPLGSFILSFSGYVDDGGLSITYNIADFLNRIAFGLAILTTAILASKDDTNA